MRQEELAALGERRPTDSHSTFYTAESVTVTSGETADDPVCHLSGDSMDCRVSTADKREYFRRTLNLTPGFPG